MEKKMSKEIAVEELNYEQSLEELSRIVAELESGEHTLDDSVRLFERGQALAARCAQLLKDAELKVKEISEAGELTDI
jgi:exodeoxyribonuclease VII small subunit